MPGDSESGLWQRLLRWWHDRRTDQRAGEGSNSVDWLEKEDDAGAAGEAGADANGNGGDGGDGGGDGGGD